MDQNPALVVFNRTFDEANNMLLEAREYVKFYAARDVQHLPPIERLKVSCEAMRVTARLTQIMAWLLMQKAIRAGEVSKEDYITEDARLLVGGTCLDTSSQEDLSIPPRLRDLLKQSYALYLRVQRLDERFRGKDTLSAAVPHQSGASFLSLIQ
ncbi:DUF1465 family protein [Candidatus Bealeia paramacronuclearis]|uniref:DUF1465 family protein n=1 Tax=Candidatus Bealeia paramacronuclearis TaxID=1921001 RepID=A0ABZ2C6H6_9PROT|nr:hypothetical protein [Candidatus Bealeia paramacronuclearis]